MGRNDTNAEAGKARPRDPERERLRVEAGYYRGHGLGNDYLVFEEAGETSADAWSPSEAAVRAVCDRWRGVGSDGIVVLCHPRGGEAFPLRMFNPDGSAFERSGNGLRILASHLERTGRVDRARRFTVVSGGSSIAMQVHDRDERGRYDVSVDMGRATPGAEAVELDAAQLEDGGLRHPERGVVAFQPVSVGNPHAVVFTDDEDALGDIGPFLAEHPAFGRGTNVQLARVLGPDRLRIAIWERGVGRTSASGTSSCAAAVAAVHRGRAEPGDIRVEMAGGELSVRVSPELDVVLRGSVQEVATGRLTPGFVRAFQRAVDEGEGAPSGAPGK